MYRCKDCGKIMENPQKIYEEDNSLLNLRKYHFVCTKCKSENIVEREKHYCGCCGKLLPEGRKNYCSAKCRKRGEEIYERQRKNYNDLVKSPLFSLVREIEDYNQTHNTHLTYGEYTEKIRREKENAGKKRKNKVFEKLSGADGKNYKTEGNDKNVSPKQRGIRKSNSSNRKVHKENRENY